MRRPVALALLAIALVAARPVAAEPPDWAYTPNPAAPAKPPADDGTALQVPDAARTYTRTENRNLNGVPDWHPEDHPPMPPIVAEGRKPGAFACGYCHLATGLGRPENASLAGLPAAYVEQQMEDYRRGKRTTAVPARIPAKLMIANARELTDDDVRVAARYFAGLPLKPSVRVVEAEAVPKTRVVAWILTPSGDGSEAIGDRIIEVPEDPARTELRDPRAGFVAYVPKGSIEKGRALATGGVGVACTTCHGADMRGIGPVPGLAGRSPTYMVRQLLEFRDGVRAGAWSGLMAPQASRLSPADMIAIAAYTASLAP